MICEFAKQLYNVELDCAFWSKSDTPEIKCCAPKSFVNLEKDRSNICPAYIPSGSLKTHEKDIVNGLMKGTYE